MNIERKYIRQLNESIQRNEDSSQKESLLHLIDFIENNTNFKIIDKDIDSDWGPGITIKSDAYKKIHVTVSAPKKKFNSYSAILFLDTPGVFDLSQTHKNFPAENIEEVFSTLVEKAKIYVKKLMKGKPGEWEEINKPDTVNPRELQKDMLAFIEESAQKNEAVNINKVKQDVENAVKKYFKNDKDALEYVYVDSKKDRHGRNVVEVRAELGYNGMVNLADYLDKVVRKYDRYAYFDQETSGIMTAVFESTQKNEALNLDKLTDEDAKQLIMHLNDFIKDKASKYYHIDKIEGILKKKYKAESAQKNETIDPHSDSIENWKQAAKFFSDNNYNWAQVDGNYELYSDEIEFGFVCGEEDGVFEFFSTVGDEVKEFNSKRKLLSFLKKLGLPLLNDSPKSSSGWEGDEYYLRYDLNEGYIKVLVMYDKIDVNLYGTSSETEPVELSLDASNEDIRAAVKKILTDYTSMESDQIDFIANSCPVENLERK